MESVARLHPLIGGNKRTTWTPMALTFWINGYRHNISAYATFDHVMGWRQVASRWMTSRD